jgi:hypothetical protein
MTTGDTITPVFYKEWHESTLDMITERRELELILASWRS